MWTFASVLLSAESLPLMGNFWEPQLIDDGSKARDV
jgi:hypothetical protein